jgi:hypothetical protein
MAHEAGKGSKQRPTDTEAYASGWDRIFGKKKQQDPEVDKVYNDERLVTKMDKESNTMPMPGTIGSAKITFKDE